MMRKIFNILFVLFIFCSVSCKHKRSGIPQVLIYAKNLSSTETGARVQALDKLGQKNGFDIRVTDTTLVFSDDSLKNYAAVVFLNCSAMPLNYLERIALERFIQAGGGFAGIHGLVKTTDWRWYGRMIASDSSLPAIFHDFDGGRAFYTVDTLNQQRVSSQDDLKKILNGIEYAIGEYQPLDYAKARIQYPPSENHFTKHSLIQDTFFEPTEMTILPNLDILIIQRRGEILLYKQETGKVKQVGFLNVYWKTNVKGVNAEEGMLGLSKDPAFSKNHWVYIYYSPIDSSVNRLSRFTFNNDSIDNASEKVILEVKAQRQICCHTGGSIAFGPDSLLYFSAGDNSTPFNEPGAQFVNNGYAPLNDLPGHEQYDAERSAGNTNDLRGKIMRIRVHDDGTYEIPKGNLFPPGTPKTRPEIYVMGNRNPYRISVDQKNSYLYWGEVGPDAGEDSMDTRGSRGYDEVNQARKAGYFGWPFFVGNNYVYRAYNYNTGESGPAFNPQAPKNHSRNNTGLVDLPPAQPAFIWYPYATSPDFPDLGTGGRNAMAGPVYYTDMFPDSSRYPDYYNGKLFIYDWIRGWIKAVTLQPNGDFEQMEPFMEHTKLHNCIDMEVGPDGKLYLLEYGTAWFAKNADAGLSRIDYNASVPTVSVPAETPALDSSASAHGPNASGYALTQVLDCKSCHKENSTSIGPSFQKVSEKYAKDGKATEYLSQKIIKGGSGVWGDVAMSAHPDIARKDLKEIVQYILSLSRPKTGRGK
ncbi:MAG: PQQ-dependent sugar dehydrogenase [Chitinophagales bacterium]